MDLDEIYQEKNSLGEQLYTNTSRFYWHGSPKKGLKYVDAYTRPGETVALAWASNSFSYASQYASKKGFVYHVRLTRALNIWNPSSDKDWCSLINNYPEFNVENARKRLITFDWNDLSYIKLGKMRSITRDDLLNAIKSLGYAGVFNRESYNGQPSLGVFDDYAGFLGMFDVYAWDEVTELWRSVGYPNRVYNTVTKEISIFKENIDDEVVVNELEDAKKRLLAKFV